MGGYSTVTTVTFQRQFTNIPSVNFVRYGISTNTAAVQVGWVSEVFDVRTISQTGFTVTTASHGVPNNFYWQAFGF